jgi:hypothetical protein
LRPAYASDAEGFPAATRYTLWLSVDFEPYSAQAAMQGIARIQFTNPLTVGLREIPLMLWPNDDQYQGSMAVHSVLVAGELVAPRMEQADLVAWVPLPDALPAGDSLDLSVAFSLEAGRINASAPKRFGITEGVLLAPTFYPLVPRLVAGEWAVDPAPPGGDTTNSEIAFYELEIHAPEFFALAATGVEVGAESLGGGLLARRYVSGPVRDFAFALGPFEQAERREGDVLLRAWALNEHVQDLELVLDAAAAQLALLTELVGPYPYVELDLVDAPGAFGGIEYPGLVFIGTLGTTWIVEPVVHEVAHQWFYGLIGGDQLREPWLDEAAATYAEALYYEHNAGSGRATGFLSYLRAGLREYPYATLPIGLPVEEYPSEEAYFALVYLKGALFFDELRREVGDGTFFNSLAAYLDEHRYATAESTDFQAAFETGCDCDLDELFDLWVFEGGEFLVP